MMTLQDLIDDVGPPVFEQAQHWAWTTAAGIGRVPEWVDWPDDVYHVPHDLQRLIWSHDEATGADRLALAFELYRAMPCPQHLVDVRERYDDWGADGRGLFWNEYRSLFSDPDDNLADPVGFSLEGHDYFGGDLVEEAWEEMARPAELSEKGLERLLDKCDRVPFRLTIELYHELAGDRRWHVTIFSSLWAAALVNLFFVEEPIDVKAARELLARLDLPADTEGLDDIERLLDIHGDL